MSEATSGTTEADDDRAPDVASRIRATPLTLG
jgi:hypothetical protein